MSKTIKCNICIRHGVQIGFTNCCHAVIWENEIACNSVFHFDESNDIFYTDNIRNTSDEVR